MTTLRNSDKSSIRWMNPVAGLLTGMVLALAQAGCGGPADQDNENQNLAHTEQALRGDFSQSCRDINLPDYHYLAASCADNNGKLIYSQLDLNEYLVNSNGDIWWGLGGQFYKTCDFVAFGRTQSEVVFKCKKEDGSYKETRKELDERIANINGVLTYRP